MEIALNGLWKMKNLRKNKIKNFKNIKITRNKQMT